MSEMTCRERMTALRAGMASVIPIQILPVMSALDADVRICGLPEIDLDFLMVSRRVAAMQFPCVEKRVETCGSLTFRPSATHLIF